MLRLPKTGVLDRRVTLAPKSLIHEWIVEFGVDQPQSALFCNVHMLMLSRSDVALANAMDQADLVFADGVPVAWLQKKLSKHPAGVVRGFEVMLCLCQIAADRNGRIGIYGSNNDVLSALSEKLLRRFPGLQITYINAPAYSEFEVLSTVEELDAINSEALDYLFVGLGCPKQEKWIHRYAGKLNCSVLGVGAAFDWLAGTTHMPPRWMAQSGLAWLHRLAHDPLRLWKRYLIYNTAFVFAAAKVLLLRSRA